MQNTHKHLKTDVEISMVCPAASDKKAKSIIRGWRSGECILVDIPKFNFSFPFSRYLKAGWVVRYVCQGDVIGFKTKGIDSLPSCDLFVLEFPDKLETHSLRQCKRAEVHMPVLVHTDRERRMGKYYKGMSLDISSGGIRLKTKEDLKTTRPYYLTFHLPSGEVFQEVECMVTQTNYIDRQYEVGLKFQNLPEKYKSSIDSCLVHFLDESGMGEESLFGAQE